MRFSISVRQLVDILLRSGDLEFGFSGPGRALEGIKAHRKVRKKRPPEYLAEQTVRSEIINEGFVLEINGRIDGVFVFQGRTVVEEIKSTYTSPEVLMRRPDSKHWGQVMCYACMWARKHNLESVEVWLSYWHLPTATLHTYKESRRIEELEKFFNRLVEEYCSLLSDLRCWQEKRDESISSLTFPFDGYRSGQREMAVRVFKTIKAGGRIMIEAPTGLGKTMAVMFAAIKALGEGKTRRIFFLTARTTGRIAAEKALSLMHSRGLKLRTVSLTAKDKICFSPAKECLPEQCLYASRYYDRLVKALEDAGHTYIFDRKTIETMAKTWMLCPFALSIELARTADCVICDYNYIFDPQVALRWLWEQDTLERCTLLIDEAHNLVERSRSMFSASIVKSSFLGLKRRVKNSLPDLYRELGKVNSCLAGIRRSCRKRGGQMVAEAFPPVLVERLKHFSRQAEKWLVLNEQAEFRSMIRDLYFETAAFLRVAQQYDDNYKTVFASAGNELEVKFFCLDAASRLAPLWRSCQAAVLFSATMIPVRYFKRMLGLPDNTSTLQIASTFPGDNLKLLVAHRVATYYHQRKESLKQIVELISALVRTRPGNYLVFFPSYEYLEMVENLFVRLVPEVESVKQKPSMNRQEKEQFLRRFHADTSQALVGFAVLGGVFGEGIDLEGKRLEGAVIVGVGLPAICLERELIRSYHDAGNEPGFDYAYCYPGIVRVLQAAGRVIRSETDRGLVMLIDQRYFRYNYRRFLEYRWRPIWIESIVDLKENLACW